MSWKVLGMMGYILMIELQRQTSQCTCGTCTPSMTIRRMGYSADGVFTGSGHAQYARLLSSSSGWRRVPSILVSTCIDNSSL
jgi:hypothetical protein